MENLNAEAVKKALECCTRSGCSDNETKDCPLKPYEDCTTRLATNALALITSQEQRIKELAEENEMLRAAIPLWAKQCVELEERCMQLRADTVRKMQELVRKKIKKTDWLNGRAVYLEIDKIAKEMLDNG